MSRPCASCGATVPEGEAFCDNCGTPVSPEAVEVGTVRPAADRKPQGTGPPQAPAVRPAEAADVPPSSPPPPPGTTGTPVQDPRTDPAPTAPPPAAVPSPPPPNSQAAATSDQGRGRFVGLGLLGLVLVLLLGTGGWFLLSGRDEAPGALQGPAREDPGEAVEQEPPSGEATEGSEATLGADAGSDPGVDYASVEEGALVLEVPAEWEVQTGAESEGSGTSWSQVLGSAETSVTAAPDLEAWNESGGAAGMYAVAARAFTGYTNEQIITTGPNDLSGLCTPGDARDFAKDAYSARIQTWTDCGGDPEIKGYTVAIAPETGGCAVALRIGTVGESGLETAQHIMDTLEVNCDALPEAEAPTPAEVSTDGYVPPEQTTGGYVPPEQTTGYTPPEGTTPQ